MGWGAAAGSRRASAPADPMLPRKMQGLDVSSEDAAAAIQPPGAFGANAWMWQSGSLGAIQREGNGNKRESPWMHNSGNSIWNSQGSLWSSKDSEAPQTSCEICHAEVPASMPVCQACWFEKWNATAKLGTQLKEPSTKPAGAGVLSAEERTAAAAPPQAPRVPSAHDNLHALQERLLRELPAHYANATSEE